MYLVIIRDFVISSYAPPSTIEDGNYRTVNVAWRSLGYGQEERLCKLFDCRHADPVATLDFIFSK